MTNIFDQNLDPNSANFTALSPVSFVERSAEIFGDLSSVVHGHRKYTWAQTRDRSARLAAALRSLGVARGTTVSAMLPNIPEMLEVHYAVPALNAVLNPLNTRLDAALIAWQLNHCECAVLITDREFAPVMAKALDILKTQFGRSIVVVDVCDSEYTGPGEQLGQFEYEAWLAGKKEEAAIYASTIGKQWTFDELMVKGEQVYGRSCAGCHQANGEGITGVFPALKDSPIALGPAEGHIAILIDGVAGSAMQSFAEQLSEVEIAAVVHYERNAWGNDVGDIVQPINVLNFKQSQ